MSESAKEEIKRLQNECETLLKAKVKRLRDEKRMRDSAGRIIRKTIRDPRGQILSKGSEDEDENL